MEPILIPIGDVYSCTNISYDDATIVQRVVRRSTTHKIVGQFGGIIADNLIINQRPEDKVFEGWENK